MPNHLSVRDVLEADHDVRPGELIDERLESLNWPSLRTGNSFDLLYFGTINQTVFRGHNRIRSNDDNAIALSVDFASCLNAIPNPDGFPGDGVDAIQVTLLLVDNPIEIDVSG